MILQQNLLDEVFKWCLHDDAILDVVCKNIGSEDIPKSLKSYDAVLAIIKQHRSKSNDKMTLGELEQIFFKRGFKDELLFERIRKATLGSRDSLLVQLTLHVRSIKSIQAYEDFGEEFQKSDKDQAVTNLTDKMKAINELDLAIHEIDSHNPFLQLTAKLEEAEIENEINGYGGKMPFCIPPIDESTGGGMDVGDTALFILPSGGGKSTILKSITSSATRRGYRGIHFQLEGSSTEANYKYGMNSTGLSYLNLQKGYIPNKPLKKPRWVLLDGKKVCITSREEAIHINEMKMSHLYNTRKQFSLDVIGYERLGEASMSVILLKIQEWIDTNGCNPDFVIIDSLDLLYPGDGQKYTNDPAGTKARIQACTKAIKNAATIFHTRILTATQTSDIPMEKWNDPKFVITRNHSMGDKNVANPFSYVFTGNRTIAEKKMGIARIYIDKLRHSSIENPVVYVKTDFNSGRYVDIKGTIEKFNKLNDPNYVPPLKEDKNVKK